MACRLFGAGSLPEPMVDYYWSDSWEQMPVKFESKRNNFRKKIIFKMSSKMEAIFPGPSVLNV